MSALGGRGRRRVTVVVLLVVALVAAWLWRRPEPRPDRVRVVAAGGLACDPADPKYARGEGTGDACRQRAVSDVAVALQPDAFLGLGDYQYEEPKAASYATAYDGTWGRLRSVTRPALGNQEYKVHDANTFFDYFGSKAGPELGWYSWSVGRWHVVVLNSNCTQVGGCDAGSEQARWLEQDLADNDDVCTIAYWHHPRFSTGLHGSDVRTHDLWQILQDHHAELVLAAHEHDYERFARLDADGHPSPTGIASFVVGTGGQAHYTTADSEGYAGSRRGQAPSVRRLDRTHGVLELTLDPAGWSSRYLDDSGRLLDAADGTCR